MNKLRVTYLALGASIFAASCTKEAAEPDIYDWADGKIYIKTSLAYVASSRGQDMTLDALESFQVTFFNIGNPKVDKSGIVEPYFEDLTFVRDQSTKLPTYIIPESSEQTYDWPEQCGDVSFIAFTPSLAKMAEGITAIGGTDQNSYWGITNQTKKGDNGVDIDYSLGKIRINNDISKQYDFLTATTTGHRIKDFLGGVDLKFEHQMSQVELRAWGGNNMYDCEIAGVCLGNPEVEGTFAFHGGEGESPKGRWITDTEKVRGLVEYHYRGTTTSSGDKVYRINSFEHHASESAASIMGTGGCAMVIPTQNEAWEGSADPNRGDANFHTDKMYFSILMCVTQRSTGNQVFPYSQEQSAMTKVYYAVATDGTIINRLYPGPINTYFTDEAKTQEYSKPADVEIKQFGWAAVPVTVDWQAGKRYVYTLDYTHGVGLTDPRDPYPGEPIISDKVAVYVEVTDWKDGTQTGVTVPRK